MLPHIRITIFSAIIQYIMFDLYIAYCHIWYEYHIYGMSTIYGTTQKRQGFVKKL